MRFKKENDKIQHLDSEGKIIAEFASDAAKDYAEGLVTPLSAAELKELVALGKKTD